MMQLNKESHYLFSICQLDAMLLCFYNRSIQAKLLETDDAGEVFNAAENKANSITDIFLRKYYLDLVSLQLYSWEIFSENLIKTFS